MVSRQFKRKKIKGSEVDFSTVTIIDYDYIALVNTDGAKDKIEVNTLRKVEVVDAQSG